MPASPDPPRTAARLLSLLIRDEAVRDDVLADLDRGFRSRVAEEGRGAAFRWYWRQAVGVVGHRCWARLVDADVAEVRRRRRGGRERGRPGGGVVVETIVQDVRHAVRGFVRSPGFTAVAVVTVALGVGVNAAIYSVVDGVLFRSLPYPDVDGLVYVWPEKRWSGQMFEQVRERVSSFESMSMVRGVPYTLLDEGESEEVPGARVSVSHFEVLGVGAALGRTFLPEEDRVEGGGVAVISHGLWQRRYGGDPGIVGRTVRISGMGRELRRVVGVLPPDHRPLIGDAQVWTPVDMSPDSLEYAGQYGFSVVARLAAGRGVEAASAEVGALVPQFAVEHPTQFREARHSPVDVVGLTEVTIRDVRGLLLTLLAAVAVVLLIACTNVANLLLARTLRRQEEISLRLALGAERGRILRQILTESGVLGLLGGAVGVVLAHAAMPFLRAHFVSSLPGEARSVLDVRVLAFALAASLLAGLLFGVAPALRAVRARGRGALGRLGRGAVGRRGQNLVNGALVASEVALSVVLVVGASLVVKSFWKLTREDVGFPTEGILAVEVALPQGRYGEATARDTYYETVAERLSAVPGVASSGAVTILPLSGGNAGFPYTVEGQPLQEGTASLVANYRIATPGYFPTLGVRLVEGRLLGPEDRVDEEAERLTGVINQAFRDRHWPGESAVGRRVLTGGGEPFFEVVGVVSNVRQTSLAEAPHPAGYFTPWQVPQTLEYLVVRAEGDSEVARSSVVEAIRAVDPEVALVSVRTMREVVGASLGSARSVMSLFSAFAGLALLLGLVGVYGVTSYAVSQRTREMGVRLALGASGLVVLGRTLRNAMTPVAVGIGAGVVLALASTRVLGSLLFQVEPTDATVFVGVAAALVVAGIAASIAPARRAARADPVVVLRGE